MQFTRMPHALQEYQRLVEAHGRSPFDEVARSTLEHAARNVARDHVVPEAWEGTKRHYQDLITVHSSLVLDPHEAKTFADLYLRLWSHWPIDLKGIAEDFEIQTLLRASQTLCEGLKAIRIRTLKIVESGELIRYIRREAQSLLQPELLAETAVVLEGRTIHQPDRRLDEWVNQNAYARYCPDTQEIHLSRKLVGIAFDLPKVADPWLNPDRDLVPTLAHELTHALQFQAAGVSRSNPALSLSRSNPVLRRYMEHRDSLPSDDLESAEEWVRKYYRAEFWLAEEMARMAENKDLWDHPAFGGFVL